MPTDVASAEMWKEALLAGASALRYRAERLSDITKDDDVADELIARWRLQAQLLESAIGGAARAD